eukprot:365187-Chlamydomonas_euryale.AAC.28
MLCCRRTTPPRACNRARGVCTNSPRRRLCRACSMLATWGGPAESQLVPKVLSENVTAAVDCPYPEWTKAAYSNLWLRT